jgi:hypothetical protein
VFCCLLCFDVFMGSIFCLFVATVPPTAVVAATATATFLGILEVEVVDGPCLKRWSLFYGSGLG